MYCLQHVRGPYVQFILTMRTRVPSRSYKKNLSHPGIFQHSIIDLILGSMIIQSCSLKLSRQNKRDSLQKRGYLLSSSSMQVKFMYKIFSRSILQINYFNNSAQKRATLSLRHQAPWKIHFTPEKNKKAKTSLLLQSLLSLSSLLWALESQMENKIFFLLKHSKSQYYKKLNNVIDSMLVQYGIYF